MEEQTEIPVVEELPEEILEEEPPRVLEIHPPPGFEDPAMAPLIEAYMRRRGLTDYTQAAIKLATSMHRMGIDPQRDIQNVNAYLTNMSDILDAIPNMQETLPVKGAIAGSAAMEASRRLRESHFPEDDLDADARNLMKYVTKMRMTMGVLDTAFSGGENVKENSRLERIEARMDKQDEERKFNALLDPLKT
ncbi:unnamed protein product, partial [marine sediment metagenome]